MPVSSWPKKVNNNGNVASDDSTEASIMWLCL